MRHRRAVLVSLIVFVVMGVLPSRADGIPVPTIEWTSGDHDLYQTCDRSRPDGARNSAEHSDSVQAEIPVRMDWTRFLILILRPGGL